MILTHGTVVVHPSKLKLSTAYTKTCQVPNVNGRQGRSGAQFQY